MKIKKLLILPAITVIALAGCSTNKENENKPKSKEEIKLTMKQELNYYLGSSDYLMDTVYNLDANFSTINNNVFESLYRKEKSGFEPGVAKKYKISDDHRTYTFYLNKEAKWSNGDNVTANDFVYSWKRAIDPKNASPVSSLFSDIKNYVKVVTPNDPSFGKVDNLGIKALDDYTFEVTFERAMNEKTVLNIVSFPSSSPQDEKFATKLGKKYGTSVENTVFNGPFKVTEIKKNEKIALEKNDKYWDNKKVKLEKITYKILNGEQQDATNLMKMYDKGEINRVTLDDNLYSQFKTRKDIKVIDNGSIDYFQFNMSQKAFQNKSIRKAFELAWNKDEINKDVYDNSKQTMYSLVPKGIIYSISGEDFYSKNFNGHDPKKAKELFEKGMKEENLNKLHIVIGLAGYDDLKNSAAEMKLQLEKTLPNLSVDFAMYNDQNKYFSDIYNGKVDLFYLSTTPGFEDPLDYLSAFMQLSPINLGKYYNEKYEKLVQEGTMAVDDKEKFKKYKEAEKIVVEEDPAFMPFIQGNSYLLESDYVHGLYRPTVGSVSYKYAYLYKEKN